jgi:hypothetical protein
LVDQWRLIAFNANALRAGLDVFFEGDLGNVGNNPVAFNGQNGSLRVGMRFDAPFTRRLERNNYRSVLVQYQLERRQLYQYQDGVNFTLRNLLRTLNQLEVNLEIQRRAMVIAIRRVDKTREDLNEPPPPTLPGQPVQLLGPTVAQNLIFALNDLLASQNVFMSVIFNHFENRMLLYRELGIMELDDCGIWIDKPINAADWLTEEQCPMPPAIPSQWMKDAGVEPEDLEAGAAQSSETGGSDASASLLLLPEAAAESDDGSTRPGVEIPELSSGNPTSHGESGASDGLAPQPGEPELLPTIVTDSAERPSGSLGRRREDASRRVDDEERQAADSVARPLGRVQGPARPVPTLRR